jgi:hypothetical protein
MLYVFFCIIPRRLNFICRRFGALCLFLLHTQVGICLLAYEDRTYRVFRNVGIQNSDARELPRRKYTSYKTRRKFEIKSSIYNVPNKQTCSGENRFGTPKFLFLVVTMTAWNVFMSSTETLWSLLQRRYGHFYRDVMVTSTETLWSLLHRRYGHFTYLLYMP